MKIHKSTLFAKTVALFLNLIIFDKPDSYKGHTYAKQIKNVSLSIIMSHS